MVVLYIRTNDLKSNQNPSDMANKIIYLAKNTKGSRTRVDTLIPCGDRLYKKGKNVNQELTRKMYHRELGFNIT